MMEHKNFKSSMITYKFQKIFFMCFINRHPGRILFLEIGNNGRADVAPENGIVSEWGVVHVEAC